MMNPMGVRDDCRHYSTRTTSAHEVVQRCRLGANEDMPFACPDGCLFFEARELSDRAWSKPPDEPDGGLYPDR